MGKGTYKFILDKFKKSTGVITTMTPAFITSGLGRLFTLRPYIDTAKCVLCGACVNRTLSSNQYGELFIQFHQEINIL